MISQWTKPLVLALALLLGVTAQQVSAAEVPTLKVSSYEPTVELYKILNPAFEAAYKTKHGKEVKVSTDHGPSGKQARDIAAGKETDVAALSVDFDIDQIAKAGLTDKEWRKRLPNGAVPYYSAVVFLVRKGNPKQVKDWEDLARKEVESLAPNPKTGGGARWIYLSAWAHALRKNANDEAKAKAFTEAIYSRAILDPAMRGSTTRFVQQETGDVLFGWENEILQVINDPATKDKFELVVPSDSITIEVPLAVVDKVAAKHGVTELAKEYTEFLYSDAGQEIIAKQYNRPSNAAVAEKYKDRFAPVTLFKFTDHFTDWPTVMKTHFADGALLDQMRKAKR